MASGPSMAQGSEPRPPAFDTAAASAWPCTPAMGAWMIGSSMPRNSGSFIVSIRLGIKPALEQPLQPRSDDVAHGRNDQRGHPKYLQDCLSAAQHDPVDPFR